MLSTLTTDETHRSFYLRSWNSLQPAKRTAISADNGRSEGPSSVPDTARQQRSVSMLLPVMALVLIAFLIICFALPVLPLHVHQGLGLSTFVVGLVTGSQFAASLISRVWSGNYADSRG